MTNVRRDLSRFCDQGGCAESSRPTTHDDPVVVAKGVTHNCVANMPGAFARTATQALWTSFRIANGLQSAGKHSKGK